ncbi:MAG: hypothetical protein JW861_11910 [Bacteroidales bacterium]|nr:hypothetical protein [Bacteroidales bacterium]
MKKVKIYGERNSGTIYLEWLINKNLDVRIEEGFEYGWKHRMAPDKDELSDELKKNVVFLCIVKNPYSWLLSIHKRPYQHEVLKELSFTEFIRYSYGDYRNPVVMWNTKNRSYLAMADYVEHHAMICYEDLLREPKERLEEIAVKFGFEKPGLFRNIQNILTNSHGINKQRFHSDYYLKERWRVKLNNDHIRYINSFLDTDLVRELKYTIL